MIPIIAIARGFAQLVILLLQISPDMVKLWKAWQSSNGRLSANQRRDLAVKVKSAVETKNTADLEDILRGKK